MPSPIDEAVYVIGGPDSRYEHWIPDKNITVHFLPAEYHDLGSRRSTYGINGVRIRFFCEPLDKQAFKMGFRCIWSRAKLHEELKTENPHICERCWRKYYKALGEDVPQQPERNPLAGYEVLPIREVIDTRTGERWTPALILRRKGSITNGLFMPWSAYAYREHDLKADGTPRKYAGHHIGGGVTARTVYYDADLEYAAREIRAEIAMHERKLAEAKAHLADLYKEDEDAD